MAAVVVLLALGALVVAIAVACEPFVMEATEAGDRGSASEPHGDSVQTGSPWSFVRRLPLGAALPLVAVVVGLLVSATLLSQCPLVGEGGWHIVWIAGLIVVGAGTSFAIDRHRALLHVDDVEADPLAVPLQVLAPVMLSTGLVILSCAVALAASLRSTDDGARRLATSFAAWSLGALMTAYVLPRARPHALMTTVVAAALVAAARLPVGHEALLAAWALTPFVAGVLSLLLPVMAWSGPSPSAGRWLWTALAAASGASAVHWLVPTHRVWMIAPALAAVLAALAPRGLGRRAGAARLGLAVLVLSVAFVLTQRAGEPWHGLVVAFACQTWLFGLWAAATDESPAVWASVWWPVAMTWALIATSWGTEPLHTACCANALGAALLPGWVLFLSDSSARRAQPIEPLAGPRPLDQ